MDDDATRHAYDAVASAYARLLPGTQHEAPFDLAMVDAFVAEVVARGGVRVLDAGCGTGRMLAHLRERAPGLRLEGVDLSPAMAALAAAAHPEARISVGTMAAMPSADASLDGILAWYSIIHTVPSGLRTVFDEFHRALRPGGVALIGFQEGDGEREIARAYGHAEVTMRAHLHTVAVVADAARDAGLVVAAHAVREARPRERHRQAFVVVERPPG